MTKEKAERIAYAIVKECGRYDLYELLNSWEITCDEFNEFLKNAVMNADKESEV